MLTPITTQATIDTPRGERRMGTRQKLLLRIAKLRCHSGEYPCVIHDVSEQGVRLRLFNGHPPDEHMFLELPNGEFYAVARRWIDGPFAGYRFSCRVDMAEFVSVNGPKRRRPVRLRIAHPTRIVVAGEGGRAMLVNLSQHGACIEADREIALRALLRIEIPGATSRLAHVCWRRNYRHGLVFQEALSLEGLARIAIEIQPYRAETTAVTGPVYAMTA
jgi:hypothetical protein